MRIIIIALCYLLTSNALHSQCTGCTQTISGNSAANINLNSNSDVLCITGGTFTGSITFNNGRVCIGPSATFRPGSLNFNTAGRIDNYGIWVMTNGFNVATGTTINNYNTMDIAGNINFNGNGTIWNDFPKYMTFRSSIAVGNGGTITNTGFMFAATDFSTQSGGQFINVQNSRSYIMGNFNVGGYNRNSGYVRVKGFININSGSDVINDCSFVSDQGININGSTFTNNGFLVVSNFTGSELFRINGGAALIQASQYSIVATQNFENGGTVTGRGKIRASNNTVNQGPFGNDALGLTFFDATQSIPRIFDLQNTAPHLTVNRNPVPVYDSTYARNVCSSNAILLAQSQVSITGEYIGNHKTNINWTTAQNEMLQSYTVEGSSNGTHWNTIQTILTQANTNEYSIADVSNYTYYRIKLLTIHNTIAYTNVVKIIRPNHTHQVYTQHNNIIIQSNGTMANHNTITVFNTNGTVMHKQVYTNTTNINIPITSRNALLLVHITDALTHKCTVYKVLH